MGILSYILPFIGVLGVLVFIHEFGHFAVAKLLKIKVETFSLGFGPRLLGFKWGDTDYQICIVPLGGYVKMKGENIEEELENTGDEFMTRPKWQKFLVLLAGPVMNIITAIAIPAALAMFLFHEPVYRSQDVVVGSVALSSAGAAANIQPGDKIIRLDKSEHPTWRELELKVSIHPDLPLPITLERNGQQIETTLTPRTAYIEREKTGSAGLWPALKEEVIEVDKVGDGTPAQKAGLLTGDKIIKLNSEPVKNFYWFKDSIQAFNDKEITVTVQRKTETLELKIKPAADSATGQVLIGFSPKAGSITPIPFAVTRKPLGEAIQISLNANYEAVVLTKDVLKQVFSGKRKAGEALSGPIQIAEISGKVYQNGGIESLLSLTALLSLNLGVFNLFPIPVLDGGHIFILFIEGLLGLIGYTLSFKIKEKMLQAGFVMLVLLMGFVIINDFSKVWSHNRPMAVETKPVTPAPAPPPPSPPANK